MRSILVLLAVLAVASAVAPIHEMDSPLAIKGSYIVILNDGAVVADRDTHIEELKTFISKSNDHSSKIGFLYSFDDFVGFSADLSKKALEHQVNHPNVKYIEVDQLVTATATTQTGATWGLNRIDQRTAVSGTGTYSYNTSAGAGVDVYVVDTGILTTHVDFGGRATAVYNAITGESSQDLNGHGTHCAGTIGGTTYGVAKKVNLKGVKVLGKDGSGTNAGVIAGVNYIGTNAKLPSVASMSLGGGNSPTLVAAVQSVIKKGIPFAVAAGNENQNACNVSPANAPNATTVGATQQSKDTRASYSNYGTCVDIFAPGSAITSDWIGASNTATSTISGTSMATPHVAGVLALHFGAFPKLTPLQLSTWLNSVSTPNVVTNPGTGSPNRLLYSPYA